MPRPKKTAVKAPSSPVEAPVTPEVTKEPGYQTSALQGHAVRMADPGTNTAVRTIDITTGEVIPNPAELVLKDDTDGYYSHSFIKSISSCSAAALFRKQRVPSKPAFALERGSAVHGPIERFIKNGLDVKKELASEWQLRLLDHFSEFSESDQRKINTLYDETELMVTDFVFENRALVESGRTESEVEFSVELDLPVEGGSIKRRVFGKIDWIVWNTAHTKYEIHDFKSSAAAPPDEELDRDVQFALYQRAATILYGFPPERMYFYLLRGVHICTAKEPLKSGPRKGQIVERTVSFSKDHVRTPECMKYAFEIKIKAPEEIDNMLATYYLPIIVQWEAGLYSKRLDDARKCLTMCSYKDHCDTVKSFPLPKFVRVEPHNSVGPTE